MPTPIAVRLGGWILRTVAEKGMSPKIAASAWMRNMKVPFPYQRLIFSYAKISQQSLNRLGFS